MFGWASPPKIALLKLTMPRAIKNIYDRNHVLQDLFVPAQELEKSIKFLQEKVNVWYFIYKIKYIKTILILF